MPSGSHPTATYTIAWIAALPHERAAALTMLDERHPKPKDLQKNPRDDNSYSWGRIGDHNIVIASLPDGVYGTTSAATTAACLVSSLPHIRVGLLVGIGAGITGETYDENGRLTLDHDVLLGDVVVGQPKDGKGGVVLHDVIKAKMVEGKRQTTLNGHLNQPPNALLHALGALRAEHLCEPSRMPELLSVFQAKEMMKDTFVYPGQQHDPVRVALQTPDSTKTRDAPKIHYGTIASGNKLIKNRQERDNIVKWLSHNKIDAICFEMEAGGLMNTFPCIVIRGICDYADERKNDAWQCYAAATAAAFAKELLDYFDTDEIEGEATLAQRLEELQLDVHDIKINASRLITNATDKEMGQLQDWLCSTDYTSRLHEHQRNYHPGTVSWFFEDERYQTWVEYGQGSVLLCEGHPGTGKSTLASHVIEVLQRDPTSNNPRPVLYLFFDHKMQDTQTANHVLRSLLQQLVGFLPDLPSDLWESKKKKERLTSDKLYEYLQTTLSSLGDVFLILDALDEAPPRVCNDLITRLVGLSEEQKLHFLATSRCLPAITNKFDSYPYLEVTASPSDVDAYVRRRTLDFRDERLQNADLVDTTVAAILTRCSGMFLLARLLMDILVARVATPASLKRALVGLPTGEDAYRPAYDSILERITSQQGDFRDLGLECLAWVVFANRPLRPRELGHALATKSSDEGLDLEDVPNLELLPSLCAGLITVNYESDTVSLVHFTAHEYLVEIRHIWFPEAEFLLADRCLKYLTLAIIDFDRESLILESNTYEQWIKWARYEASAPRRATAPWPFMHYALTEWPIHAASIDKGRGDNDAQILSLSLRLAKFSANKHLCFWIRLPVIEYLYRRNYSSISDDTMAALAQLTFWHSIVFWDLARLCEALLVRVEYDNSKYLGWTPLMIAARHGCTEAGRVLLIHTCAQADETEVISGTTVLHHAAQNGHAAFMEMLFAEKPSLDLNVADSRQRTPLFAAAQNGRSNVVKYILTSASVDVNRQDVYGATALQAAAMQPENHDVLPMLLSHPEVDVNIADNNGQTALIQAAGNGLESFVRVLLSHPDIEVNRASKYGTTALSQAEKHACDAVVKLLLSHPAIDVNQSNKHGSTALRRAAASGQDELVRELLSNPNFDIKKEHGMGTTVLTETCRLGRVSTVKILLDTGDIDLEARDSLGLTPLASAAGAGHTDIVRMLAVRGANAARKDQAGLTALFILAASGDTDIVRETAKQRCDLNDIWLTEVERRYLSAALLASRLVAQDDRALRKVELPSMHDLELGRMDESLTILRQIPAVNALFETVEKIDQLPVAETSDRMALSWCLQRMLVSYPSFCIKCDCGWYETLHTPVFWLCSLCSGHRHEHGGLAGLVFSRECVKRGTWCNDRRHSMKKVDLRAILEGHQLAFIYPFAYPNPPRKSWLFDIFFR